MPTKYGNKNYVYLHDLANESPRGGAQLVTFNKPSHAKMAAAKFGGKVVKTDLNTYRVVKPAEQGVAEDLRTENPCWKGYHPVGTKKKGGKTVPNCVPTNEEENSELAEEFDLIESIVESIAERNSVDAELVWEDLESLTDDELYVFAVTTPVMEDWQKVNKKDKTDGMSAKAVKAYRREHPGSKLKTAVTTKPSKLKKGSKASKRRKSYCSRSRGQMKMHNISCAKTPDKAICKARRRWNC